jgi:hypothetical protein
MIDDIGLEEDVSGLDEQMAIVGYDDELGFSFGKLVKGIAKGVKSVATSSIAKVGVGVLAVAFPAVGVPAAAALAAANLALKKVDDGVVAAKTINANLSKLKTAAHAGDPKAATAVNAMQVALAQRKARAAGVAPPVAIARPGVSSFSTTPRPAAAVLATQQPTSLYQPSTPPEQIAVTLSGGGSELGRRALAAVQAGKSVEVPNGALVVPGSRPVRGRRVWIGKAPTGARVAHVAGAHVVTQSGYVLSGQSVFVAA